VNWLRNVLPPQQQLGSGERFSLVEILAASVLAFGTQVRGFAPGRSRRIFRVKKSSARLPSEGN